MMQVHGIPIYNVTGTLVVPDGTVVRVGITLVGELYGDKSEHGNHPLPDGELVYTSRIQRVMSDSEGTFIKTRNSIYRILTVGEFNK